MTRQVTLTVTLQKQTTVTVTEAEWDALHQGTLPESVSVKANWPEVSAECLATYVHEGTAEEQLNEPTPRMLIEID